MRARDVAPVTLEVIAILLSRKRSRRPHWLLEVDQRFDAVLRAGDKDAERILLRRETDGRGQDLPVFFGEHRAHHAGGCRNPL